MRIIKEELNVVHSASLAATTSSVKSRYEVISKLNTNTKKHLSEIIQQRNRPKKLNEYKNHKL